jgi:hypothetical protein
MRIKVTSYPMYATARAKNTARARFEAFLPIAKRLNTKEEIRGIARAPINDRESWKKGYRK